MPLVALHELFADARIGGYALGYFEAWDGASIEAVLQAAEAERAPVILGFGCMMLDQRWLDAGGVEQLAGIGRAVARRAHVPAALLLNEARTFDQAVRGMEAGFNAVMLDTSAWDDGDAVAAVAKLTRLAHQRGVAVEAELGRLPDATSSGIDASGASLTDPEHAARFIAATGADCLAVSIGNVHLLTRGHAPVDLDRLRAIQARVTVPLVIHGGTSFPPAAVPAAISAGVLKFNVGTGLKKAFLNGVRATMRGWPERPDVHAVLGSHSERDMLAEGQARMRDEVRRLIRLYQRHSDERT